MGTPSTLLSVSIVLYRSDPVVLRATLGSLARAVEFLAGGPAPGRPGTCGAAAALYLIDNDSAHAAHRLVADPELAPLFALFDSVRVLDGHGNIGYGRAHNLVLPQLDSRYHLILNPDVVLARESLRRALEYLDSHPEFGLLAPRVTDPAGHLQFLCRRYPSLLDLLVRGFLPRRWRAPFATRLARYEMRDLIGVVEVVPNPPIVSGCFMFVRTELLRDLGGFDPRYFLYFEDYDLSIRAASQSALVYVPSVEIEHGPGGAARKGWHHIRLFLVSAFRFFSSHGWRVF